MMRNRFEFCLLAVAGALGMAGCCCNDTAPGQQVSVIPQGPPMDPIVQLPPPPPVVIVDPQPEPRVEVIEVQPNEARVWVAGSWIRSGPDWVWLPGHQEIWERPGAEAEREAWGGTLE